MYNEEKKYAALAILASDDVRTIKCRFFNGEREYTYKSTKELAEQLEDGDFVVVSGKGGQFKVVEFVSVDAAIDVNLEGEIEYQWAISRVCNPMKEAERLDAAEKRLVDGFKKGRLEAARRSALLAAGIDPDHSVTMFGGQDNIKLIGEE